MYVQEKEISGWGNYPLVKTKIYQPYTQKKVLASLEAEKNIPRGLGRSYGDQSVNVGYLTTVCTRLNHFLSFDKNTGILECEAGVSHDEIIQTFAPRGWFPMITPGTKYITIGGAIANNIHGKAHHVDGSFVNCVEEFTILLADGSIKTASRTENTDLFWANFGGLGLLGIILTAKIRLRAIETTYFHQKAVVLHNLDEMIDALYEYDEKYNYSVAWVNALAKGKHLGRGVLTLGNQVRLEELPDKLKKKPLFVAPPPKLSVPFYLPDFALNTLTVNILNKALDTMQRSAGKFAHYEKFFYPLDFVRHWNRGYGKRGFIQYQFVIPLENVKQNIRVILEKIASSGCAPFLNVLKKLGKGQNYLSFSREGFTFAIDFPVTKNIPNLIRELDRLVLDFGGRIYLGKDAMLDKETFRAMYPHYEEWLAIKAKYDPDNKFSSNISRRLGLEVDATPEDIPLPWKANSFETKP
jgi:decaprenylphospho-beta-D-ribofuranose 2-oxidase